MHNCVRTKHIPNYFQVSLTSKIFQQQLNKYLKLVYASLVFLNSILSQVTLSCWFDHIPTCLFIPLAFPFQVFVECTRCLEFQDNNAPLWS